MNEDDYDLVAWLYDAGVGESQTVTAEATPEMIPHFRIGKEIVAVNATKTVRAVIDKGSKIEWSDDANAWIATLVIRVASVDVIRDLRLEES